MIVFGGSIVIYGFVILLDKFFKWQRLRTMFEFAGFIRIYETSYFHILLTSYLTLMSDDASDLSFAISIMFMIAAIAYPFVILYVMNSRSDWVESKKLSSWHLDVRKETFMSRNFATLRAFRRLAFLSLLVSVHNLGLI